MLELLWIKSLFDFAALLLGLLFMLYLKTRYPQPSILVKGLIVFLICQMVIDLLGFIQYTSWLNALLGHPQNISHGVIVAQLSYAPVLYFCCRAANVPKLRLKIGEAWHYLPAFLYLLGALVFPSGIEDNQKYLLVIVEVHFILYAFSSLTVLKGGIPIGSLLRTVLLGLLIWRLLRLVEYLAWLHMQWIEEPTAWGLYIFSELVFLWTLGYLFFKVIRQPSLLQEGSQWVLSSSSRQRIKIGLQDLVMRDRIYLDPLLSLDRLAKALQVPPHYLSQYLNRELKMTFNEWVNSHRIEECKRLIADPKQQNRTIQSLMYQVGFNSKSTFHTAFKKNTGLTPTQFRKSISVTEQ